MANDSGIGTYIRNLVPLVIRAKPAWRFTLLGDAGELRALGWDAPPNVTLRGCTAPIYSPREQWELRRRTPGDVDLFWSPHYNIPLLSRGPLAVTIHDLGHLILPEFDRPLPRTYARMMFAAVRRRASVVMCDSAFTRDEYTRRVGVGRAAPVVIHLGVSDEWRSVGPRAAAAGERPYVIYVGNVKPHKNLGALVRAFGMIAADVPHDLVIVGRREGMRTVDESVQQQAASLGDRVRITGEVAAGELRQLVAGADALVMPSLFEGFGLPPLEAMAAGCPTLVARAASLPEVCGDASLYCDPRDENDIARQLTRMLQDPVLRDDLRQRGVHRAATFTWSRTAEATLAALERGLGGASTGTDASPRSTVRSPER